MRYAIPVILDEFPSCTHTKVLAGRQHGYDRCQILFTRFVKGERPRSTLDDGMDRLMFVCARQLAVQSASGQVLVAERNLIRLPRGYSHSVSNPLNADVLCLEVTAPAPAPPSDYVAPEPELSHLVATFPGHGPLEHSSGFDYHFLANRKSGSTGVALNIARVLPGHRGPDFHIHTFDQFYFVLNGRLSVEVGFERFVAPPFTMVALPSGIVHRQGNQGTVPEEHLAIISPEPAAGQPLDHQVGMPEGA